MTAMPTAAPRPRDGSAGLRDARARRRGKDLIEIDIAIGARVRTLRIAKGLSQERLAQSINLTFQQLQKYERGANRIPASRVWSLAEALDVPVSAIFDGLSDRAPAADPTAGDHGRLMVEFNKALHALPPDVQRPLLAAATRLLRAAAGLDDGGAP
jgi:transcriptional regulator with XRE-family HTH domain